MSDTNSCPRCGHAASGNFCASCGAALARRHCTECGAAGEPGSRFCTKCGTPMAGGTTGSSAGGAAAGAPPPRQGAQAARVGTTGGDSRTGWLLAGGMLVALVAVLVYPILNPDDVAPTLPTQAAPAGPFGNANAVDLSAMTPREQADALFTRVMAAAEQGDSSQVAFFVPMAIDAYDIAEPLDADGLFHVSMLQQTADDLPAAVATAERGLADAPNHLLLLYAKAEAQIEMGDTATAAATFRQLLGVWDAERATDNIDYVAHDSMMPSIEARAQMIGAR